MIDVISKGRLECGFARSAPYEAAAANILPYRERLREARAPRRGPRMTVRGRRRSHRQANVWPRPLQQPHPSVTTGSAASAAARHGHIGAVFLPFTLGSVLFSTPTARTASGTTANARRSTGWPIARSSTSAKPRTGRTGWCMQANRVSEPWRNPSGYHPPKLAANVAPTHPEPAPPTALISGNACAAATSSRERPAKRTGRAFREHHGGFGRMIGQAGHLSAERVLRTLHEREAYPRPCELADAWRPKKTAEKRKPLPDPADDLAVDFAR